MKNKIKSFISIYKQYKKCYIYYKLIFSFKINLAGNV